jgi:predicted enzyme related to lactoylglutathione lyase
MATRENAPLGAPCWVDLNTSDTAKSRDFYTQLMGWEAGETSEEHGGYFMFFKGGVQVAGCMPAMPGVPDVWTTYLASDDAQKTVDAAKANGGQIVVEPMAVDDLGTMAVLVDPGGATIGIWQPGTHKGFGVAYEAGTPSWFELHTREYNKSLDFYRDVFRWDTKVQGDTDEFRYVTYSDGETDYAGIMDSTSFLPEGAPPYWLVYLGVEDADAAIEKVEKLGGSVIRPAEDTPYGRLAAVADSTGASFNLIQGN